MKLQINTAFIILVLALYSYITVSANSIHNETKIYIYTCLNAFIFYLVLVLVQARNVLRFIFSLFIAITFFLKKIYSSDLTLSVIFSMFEADIYESTSLVSDNLGVFFIASVIFLSLYCIKIKTPNKCSLYLLASLFIVSSPTLYNMSEIFRSKGFESYKRTATVRNIELPLVYIDYVLIDIGYRFPIINNFRTLIDFYSFSKNKTKVNSQWANVKSHSSKDNYFLVIGESLRKNNMSLYGYNRETTPYLKSISDSLNIIDNAYAAGANTWSSLPAMLAYGNDYPDNSRSIVSLAKEAGFNVIWISNQSQFSLWNHSVSFIANQADYTVFLPKLDEDGSHYDEKLFDKFIEMQDKLDLSKSNLVVIHLFGSHQTFSDRYPSGYDIFGGSKSKIDAYDNSVFYTDFVMKRFLEYSMQNRWSLLFLADHGLELIDKNNYLHDVKIPPSIESLSVPLFIYPKNIALLNNKNAVSLFYFECLFSHWTRITSDDLSEEYCSRIQLDNTVKFFDAKMQLHSVKIK